MLQQIDKLEWDDPVYWGKARYENGVFTNNIGTDVEADTQLPPGVVLAQEVDAPAQADPYSCPTCHGAGCINSDVNYDIYEDTCDTCNGHGRLYKRPKAKGT